MDYKQMKQQGSDTSVDWKLAIVLSIGWAVFMGLVFLAMIVWSR